MGDTPVRVDGADLHDALSVADLVGDPVRAPAEVVVEFLAQREQGLVVDEVVQPPHLVQEGQETEVTGGVAGGDQVLEEGHLHGGVVEEHAPVPTEGFLTFQEDGVQTRSDGPLAAGILDAWHEPRTPGPLPSPPRSPAA